MVPRVPTDGRNLAAVIGAGVHNSLRRRLTLARAVLAALLLAAGMLAAMGLAR